VPALLRPQLTLTGGAGEVLEPLSPLAPFEVVVLASREQLSTPDVFAEADRLGLARSADDLTERRAALAGAFTAGAELPLELLHNDLEPAARSLCPAIDEAMQFAQRMGAEHAMVTGSGPTVVAFFRPRRGEPSAADRLDMHGTVVLSSFSRIAIAAPLTPGAAAVREERRG
jgi:4-diphosphocytidyl-2-C-methyl-D-erythritol kinase